MEKWTGSKLGKEYNKAIFCHPAYLTYMQNASCECWAEWRTSWNQDLGRNINNLQYADDTTLIAEIEKELKNLLMKIKEKSEKAGLKPKVKKKKR